MSYYLSPSGHGTLAVSTVTLCHGCSGHEKSTPSSEHETVLRPSCLTLPSVPNSLGGRAQASCSSKPRLPTLWSHVFLKHRRQAPAWESSEATGQHFHMSAGGWRERRTVCQAVGRVPPQGTWGGRADPFRRKHLSMLSSPASLGSPNLEPCYPHLR